MHTNRHINLVSGLLLLGSTALSSTAVLADEPSRLHSLQVNYVRAHLSDPASAQVLYERIQRAARQVCQQPNVQEIQWQVVYKQCYDKAVDAAVATVDATALTALHRGKSQTAG